MIPINQKMLALGEKSSVIREVFEYGNRRRAEIGAENVFDFSLGNPSVPSPDAVNAALKIMLDEDAVSVHGYTSAAGDMKTRCAVAEYLCKTHGATFGAENIYMTCGAAASLTATLNAICNAGDEVVTFAPFFPEYRVFIEKAGATLVSVPCRESDMQIDTKALDAAISGKTKAVIINSPNNPTGVVYPVETIREIAGILKRKSAENGAPVYIISDEPYRELVYDEHIKVPFIPNYYDETIVCYSFSKSLSVPGERIGYVAVSDKCTEWRRLFAAICGAGRSLGFVCAPSIFQKIIPECLSKTSDISVYKKNRDILYAALTDYGYKVIRPDGAFYMFVRSPEKNAGVFCEKAKKHELLLVPSDSFQTSGYVRISYCVQTDMILRSLPSFEALAKEYGLK